MKKLVVSLFLILIVNFSLVSPSWAHATLESNHPTDNAVLATTPENISLVFDQSVILIHSKLTRANGDDIPLEIENAATSGQKIQIALPILTPDSYQFEWSIYSEDGHPVTGTLQFTITG